MVVFFLSLRNLGGTISKCINKGFGTLLACALGVGAVSLGSLFEPTAYKPVVVVLFVFLLVALATFSRFVPKINKKKYDKIIELAHHRFSAVIFGLVTSILISVCVFPVISETEKSLLEGYKSILDSQAEEESLVNLAWWVMIRHGKFRFRHPWEQYLKIGVYTRQCAYHIETLSGYLDAKTQATDDLNTTLKASLSTAERDNINILETIPVIAVTSMLCDIIKCVETLYEAIEEISKQAHFKKPAETTIIDHQKPHFLQPILKPVHQRQTSNHCNNNSRCVMTDDSD